MKARGIIEKRRVHRTAFDVPVPASVAGLHVHLLDLSTTGARIEHDAPLAVRRELVLGFDHGDQSYALSCEIVRCRLQRSLVRPGAVAYSSGLRFTEASEASREAVRALVASMLAGRANDLAANSRDDVAV